MKIGVVGAEKVGGGFGKLWVKRNIQSSALRVIQWRKGAVGTCSGKRKEGLLRSVVLNHLAKIPLLQAHANYSRLQDHLGRSESNLEGLPGGSYALCLRKGGG
jgi:hypothetical protein